MHKRLLIAFCGLIIMYAALYMRTFVIMTSNDYQQVITSQGTYTVKTPVENGNIYDCKMHNIINSETEYIAVINPTAEAVKMILPYVKDKEDFYDKLQSNKPFSCIVDTNELDSNEITIFNVPIRYTKNQLAQHLIGYTQEGHGVCGIEKSYDSLLRSPETYNSVTYSIDGMGGVLDGKGKTVTYSKDVETGVVTTLDLEIQSISDEAMSDIEKGAAVVMDVQTGDILATVSKPNYSTYNLEDAVNDADSPMINRAFCPYNVGSIFKLVISGEAIKEGHDDFTYSCTGAIDIFDQTFHCHNLSGHGEQNLQQAITNSCNTYFVALSQLLDTQSLWEFANTLGFGRETELCDGLTSASGILPEVSDLDADAEKANFSFGQGKLMATPIQITCLTSAIANGGNLPRSNLIKGTTTDGTTIENQKDPVFTKAMSFELAARLQDLMINAINDNVNSNAKPCNTIVGCKTSTAQTGKYDEDGIEMCQAWITGFFPASQPKYAITVMVENGGYGNTSAAPVFREIAENITSYVNAK